MSSFLRRNKSSSTATTPPRPTDQLQHAASSPAGPSAIPVKSPRLSLRSRSSLRAALPMQTGPAVVTEELGQIVEGEPALDQRRKRRTSLKDLFRRSSGGGSTAAGSTSNPASPVASGRNMVPSTPPSASRSAPLSSISARTASVSSPSPVAADGSPAGSLRRKRVGSTPGEGEVPLYLRRASQASVATPTSTPPPGTPSAGHQAQAEPTTPPQPVFYHADRPRASSFAGTTASGTSAGGAPGSGHLASHAEQATTALAAAMARVTPNEFVHGRSPSAHALLQQTFAKASPPGSPTASSGIAVRRRSAASGSTSATSAPYGTGRQPVSPSSTLMPDGPPRAPASRRDTFGESSTSRPLSSGTPTGLGSVIVGPPVDRSESSSTSAVEGDMNQMYRFGRPSSGHSRSVSEQLAPASLSRIGRPASTACRGTDVAGTSSTSGSSDIGGLAIPRTAAALEPVESHPVRSPQPGEPTKDSASSAAQAAATPAWWAPGPLPPTRDEVAAFPVPPPTPPASSTAEGDVLQRQQRQLDVRPVRPAPSPTPSFGALESDELRAEASALDRIADERPTFLNLPLGLEEPAKGADNLLATSPPRGLDRALADEHEDDNAADFGLEGGFSSDGERDERRNGLPELSSRPTQVDLSLPSPPLGSQEEEDRGDNNPQPVETTHALPSTPMLRGLGNGAHSSASSPKVCGSPSRRTSSYPSPSSTASSVRGGGGDGLAPSAMTTVRAPGAASPVLYHLPARKQSHQYTRSELSELEASGSIAANGGRPPSTTSSSISDVFGLGVLSAASPSTVPRPMSIAEDEPIPASDTIAGSGESNRERDALEAEAPSSTSHESEMVEPGAKLSHARPETPPASHPMLLTDSSFSVTESMTAATPSTPSSAAFDDDDGASDGLLAPFDLSGRQAATGGTSPAASEELSSPVQILEAQRLARVQASPVVSRVSSRAPSPVRSTADLQDSDRTIATEDPRAPSPTSQTSSAGQCEPQSEEKEVCATPDSPPIDPPAPMSFFPPSPTVLAAADASDVRPATATRVRSSRRPPSPTASSSSSTPTPSFAATAAAGEGHQDRSRPLLSVTSPLPHLVPYAPVPWGLLPAGLRELAEAPELELRREDVVRAADGAARVVGAGLTVAKWGVGWWAIIPYRTGKWALGK